MSKILYGLFAFGTLVGAAGYAVADSESRANASQAPGACGEHRFWRNGQCVDARNNPSGKTWSDEMLAKKWAG
jgi:hypothetical protein